MMIEGVSRLCIHLVLLDFTCVGFKDGRSRKMHLKIRPETDKVLLNGKLLVLFAILFY
jgi:hypothetical protein